MATEFQLEMEALIVHKHCVKLRISASSPMAVMKVYANLRQRYTGRWAMKG